MTIEKRSNGKYRIKQMVKGNTYRLTVDHKPTKREAEELMGELVSQQNRAYSEHTFEEAAHLYVDIKANVLSPASVREYSRKIGRLDSDFIRMNISDIDTIAIQKEINRLAVSLSPKTVADMNGFIQAVLKMYQPDFRPYNIRLPQKKIGKEQYIPSDSDIEAIRAAAAGTPYDIAIELGILGLRRSEICAIVSDDIAGSILHIDKAMVQDINKEWVIKSTKSSKSERDVVLPDYLAERIRERGRAYEGYPGAILNFLTRTQTKLGLPHFSFHKERHYFATKLSEMNVPEADILKMGGWSTDHVMKEVYRHATIDRDLERQKALSEMLLSGEKLSQNYPQNHNEPHS